MSTQPPRNKREALARAAGSRDPIPDPDDEHRQKIRESALDYLAEKWTQSEDCPIDGSNDWYVDDVGMLAIRSGGPGSSLLPRGFPFVPIVCRTCGYTFFINELWVREGGTPQHVEDEPRHEAS